MTSPPNPPSVRLLYSDGAFNKKTTPFAWASVVDSTYHDLIQEHKDAPWIRDVVIRRHKLGPYIAKECMDKERDVIQVQFDDVKTNQNNGAELVALLIALRIAEHVYSNQIVHIYCDSEILVNAWSKGRVGLETKLNMDPMKYQYILECAALRRRLESRKGKVLWICGDDNKADLGFHRSTKKEMKNDNSIRIRKREEEDYKENKPYSESENASKRSKE